MDGKVTLQQALQYCGLAEDNNQDMKVFLRSLRAAAPDFKGFGDLLDAEQGVDAEAWDAIKDAVKTEVLSQGE